MQIWWTPPRLHHQDCLLSFEYEQALNEHVEQCHNLGNKKSQKSGLNYSIPLPKDLVCDLCGQDFGINERNGKQKTNKELFLKHQLKHKVEEFLCDCPDGIGNVIDNNEKLVYISNFTKKNYTMLSR